MNNTTRKLTGGARSQRKTQRRSIVQRFLKNQFQSRVKSQKPKSKNTRHIGISNENVKEKVKEKVQKKAQKKEKELVNANNLLEVMKSVNGKLKSLMEAYDKMGDSKMITAVSNVFVEISEGLVKLRTRKQLSFLDGYPALAKPDDPENPEALAIDRIDELTEYIEDIVIEKRNVRLGQLILDIFHGAFQKYKAELESAMEDVKARSGSNNESMHSNHENEEMNGNNARSSASNHRSRASSNRSRASSSENEEEFGDALGDLMEALKGAKI